MIAPFPYFGGKRRVSELVWQRFGAVNNYVEPFAGSLAVLLGRPEYGTIETVNDINGWISNFWRAVRIDPERVASVCDWPVNEIDLHARYQWLVARSESLIQKLRQDPEYFDAEIAGWWVWGQCAWIGDDWADPNRNRKQPGSNNHGRGITSRPHLGRGNGINSVGMRDHLHNIFIELSNRLRFTRVCCGDWSRICTPASTTFHGLTAVFLDPPYAVETRADCYINDSRTVALDVATWCRKNQNDSKLRIALCGYEGEHSLPDWDCVSWSASGGHGNRAGNQNRHRERIWFSPSCLAAQKPEQLQLFAA